MRWAALALLLASCTAPPRDGALACGSKAGHSCPDGFRCTDGRCYVAGHVFDDMSVAIEPEDLAAPLDLAQLADLVMPLPPPAIDDTFAGPAIDASLWTLHGGVAVVDDAGTSAAAIGGTLESHALAIVGDFTLRGRLRFAGATTAGNASFGLRGDHDWAFLVATAGAWQLFVNGKVTAPSSPAPISSSYATFEIKRAGTDIAFSVDGVVLYSGAGTTVDGDTIRATPGSDGQLLVDRVTLTTGP